jgi:predicted small metal-binding protein
MDDKKKISHQTSNEMERGTVNPSAPTTGTEGWANHAESEASANSPEASGPNARGAGDTRFSSYPRSEAADNPAASDQPPGEDRERMLEDNPNYRAGKSFRCADVGVENCNWSVTGTHEDEIVGNAREHAREQHGIAEKDFDSKMVDRVRSAIKNRDKAA